MASSSVVHPASSSAALLENVQQLGHYPRRFKTADTDEQTAETSLAKKNLRHGQAELPEEAKHTLTVLKKSRATDIQQATENTIL